MSRDEARLTGWRRVGASAAILALAVFNGALIYFHAAGTGSFGDLPASWARWFPLTHLAALGAGVVATAVAGALVIRGRGRRAALALALAMAAFTACSLGMLSLLAPWDLREVTGVRSLVGAFVFLPALVVVGTAAFLRFAVLFPRPLRVDELKRVGRVDAGDSLGVADRALGALARRALGRPRQEPAGRDPDDGAGGGVGDGANGGGAEGGGAEGASWLRRLVPGRVRRWMSQPVVVGSGRYLTDAGVLWRWALALAFVPYVVWWGIEVLPPAIGWEIRPTDLEALVAALILTVWIVVPVGGPILAVAILRLGYGLADEPDRRRMRWIVESLNAAVWLLIPVSFFILLAWVGIESPLLDYLPAVFVGILPLVVVLGFAVAVFYDGALEPSLVVRKSTLYGLFGFALAFLFAVTEELVSEHLAAGLGLPGGTGTLVASGLIAVVFGVFHGRFRKFAARWLAEEGGGKGEEEGGG